MEYGKMGKGIVFSIDSLYALSLAMFAFWVLQSTAAYPSDSQISVAAINPASDILRALSAATVSELAPSSPTVLRMQADASLSPADMRMTQLQLLARLYYQNTSQSKADAKAIVSETVAPLVQRPVQFAVMIGGEAVFNSSDVNSRPESSTSVSKAFVYSRQSSQPFSGPVGPVEAKVVVWS